VKIIVEVKNEEDVKKIKKLLGKEHVTVVKSPKERILENLFSKFRVKLPARYKFDR
jgi:ATP-dependent Lon protease